MTNNRESPNVIAVILSYNSLDTLISVIEAVQKQTQPVSEIIVVDNGSDDGTPAYLHKKADELTALLLAENRGVGAGHNAGWQAALQNPACDFIWSLEHDCVPAPDCLKRLIEAYTTYEGDTRIGVVAPVQRTETAGLVYIWRKKGFRKVNFARLPDRFLSRGFTFNGALLPTPLIRRAGWLNTDFFFGQEDNEYSRRLRRLGFRVLQISAAGIYHDIRKSRRKIRVGRHIFILPHSSILRSYYGTRNAIFLQKSEQNLYWLALKILLKLPLSLLYIILLENQKLARIRVRFLAVRDGLLGKAGRQDYAVLKQSGPAPDK